VSYLVLARKWRPQTFEDVVGQQATTRALTSALESGRIAHAFLFTGARGVGKTTAARILAKALNCERGPGPRPCNVCSICEEVTSGRSVDVLEIDGASNTGVDDIRDLREKVKYLPARTRYKVVIIDEVHMLSGSAFNALLKTLEEPPPHVVFVFATTEPHKIPATVLSRVQRYDFRRIQFAQVLARLDEICRSEGVTAAEGALAVIAREAEGSMRDALSLLDQAWSAAAGGELREEEVAEALGVVDRGTLLGLGRALLARDARACLAGIEQVFARGYDIRQFAGALLTLLRDLAVAKVAPESAFFDRPEHEVQEMRAMVETHEAATVYRQFDTLARAFDEIARAAYPKLLLEMTLLKMAAAEPLRPIAEALSRLEALEKRLGTSRIEAPPARTDAPKAAKLATLAVERAEQPKAVVPPPVASPPAPAAPQPVAPQPAAPTPVAPQPVAPQPVASQPVAPQPVAPQPVADPAQAWREIVERLREARRSVAALFEQGKVVALGPASVKIAFEEPFLLESAREPENVALLTDLCRKRLGAAVTVSIVAQSEAPGAPIVSLAEEERRDAESRRAETRRGLAEHPNVHAAQELLGAKLLEVRLESTEE
jgi:DNA polymerase-3 subunit gamma/tau